MHQLETGYRRFPESAASSAKDAVIVGVEAAPREIIADVVVNDAAYDLLSANVKHLATPDFLVQNVWMSVPTSQTESHVLTPFLFGRAVPIGYGVIPFGNMLGRALTGKGSWISGLKLRDAERRIYMPNNHPGLLSVEGARGDIVIANALLSNGYRSALHTGYVVFDTPKLQNWLLAKWGGSYEHSIHRSIRQVEKEAGAAYLFRVGATTERYVTALAYSDSQNRVIREIAVAARLLHDELTMPGSFMDSCLAALPLETQSEAQAALTAIGNHHTISIDQYVAFGMLTANVFTKNARAFRRTLMDLAPYNTGLGPWALWGKDIDLGHFSYDYDTFQEKYNPTILPKEAEYKYKEAAQTCLEYYFDTIEMGYLGAHGTTDRTNARKTMSNFFLSPS